MLPLDFLLHSKPTPNKPPLTPCPLPPPFPLQVAYLYTKVRAEFGKDIKFEDSLPETLESILPNDEFDANYVQRNPSISEFDTTPDMSWSECNTDRLVTKSSSMRHTQGGWPKDVDPEEMSDMQRFRKKAEKDEEYKTAMKLLGPMIGRCMKQNNTINIYEEYFDGVQADHSSEPPSAKG